MDQRAQFQEALTSLIEYAASKQNRLSEEEIKECFREIIRDESQYDLIYSYLTENKISIDGHSGLGHSPCFENVSDSPSDRTMTQEASALQGSGEINLEKTSKDKAIFESEEELSFVRMYMKELEAVPPVREQEMEMLIRELTDGDAGAADRLIELHLSTVAALAQKQRGRGVTFGDLIQEGNMGLILAVSEYQKEHGDFSQYIQTAVNEALEKAVNAQVSGDRIGKHLADQLNHLDSVTKKLTESFDRVPEISEIAKEMGITEDKVSQLLKISLDALSVNEDTHITDEPAGNGGDWVSGKDPLTWNLPKKK